MWVSKVENLAFLPFENSGERFLMDKRLLLGLPPSDTHDESEMCDSKSSLSTLAYL